MSLGLLGDYGSGSEISDSDGEYEQASGNRNNDRSSTKTDNTTSTSKTEPLIGTSISVTEGESKSAGREGDPLSYIQGDGSSSDNDSSSSDEDGHPDDKDTAAAIPLPLPDLDQLTSPTSQEMTATFRSVFSNPYKEAEEAKLSMLKHHVSDFAPDEKPSSQKERSKHHRFKGNSGIKGSRAPRPGSELLASDATHTLGGTDSQRLFNDDDSSAVLEGHGGELAHHHGGVKRKQRSGVSSTLVPPKKYLKSYGRAQAEERPWTVN